MERQFLLLGLLSRVKLIEKSRVVNSHIIRMENLGLFIHNIELEYRSRTRCTNRTKKQMTLQNMAIESGIDTPTE